MLNSITSIAEKTGLSRVTISLVLNNKHKNPTLKTMKKIADALDCSIEELEKSIKDKNISSVKPLERSCRSGRQ